RRHTRSKRDWSSDVCSSDLLLDIVSTIKRCLNYLPKDANAAAHFILSNVKPSTQETLSGDWGAFYKALTARNILSLDGLVEELRSEERRVGKECRSRWVEGL